MGYFNDSGPSVVKPPIKESPFIQNFEDDQFQPPSDMLMILETGDFMITEALSDFMITE